MKKWMALLAALWLALIALVFVYTDKDEYTWRFDGEALESVLITQEEAEKIEAEAQRLMDIEQAEAFVRSENGERKICMPARRKRAAPWIRNLASISCGVNMMWLFHMHRRRRFRFVR